uniref:Uncharacterized protein n=1 Tax=Bactrocera latifrons TaxID=174628 RepID=A0A0K8W6J8_BACLA
MMNLPRFCWAYWTALRIPVASAVKIEQNGNNKPYDILCWLSSTTAKDVCDDLEPSVYINCQPKDLKCADNSKNRDLYTVLGVMDLRRKVRSLMKEDSFTFHGGIYLLQGSNILSGNSLVLANKALLKIEDGILGDLFLQSDD